MARSFSDACGLMVRHLVRAAYNMPANSVRPSGQAAPTGKQADEFATVHITDHQGADFSFTREYTDDPTDGSTKVIEKLDALYEFSATVQFFRHADPTPDSAGLSPVGLGAYDKAVRLESRLALTPNLELMDKLGLCLSDVSPATNLSGTVDGAYYEDRGAVTLTFYVSNIETALIESIASAEIGLWFQQSGHIDHRTIEVSP